MICCLSAVAHAQDNNFWTAVNEASLRNDLFAGNYKPKAFKLFKLDERSLKTQLVNAPVKSILEKTNSGFLISIPNPDGGIETFAIAEEIERKRRAADSNSEIKTYRGQGVNDSTAKIGFVFSRFGFHAMITSLDRGTFYIDPVDNYHTNYMVSSGKDAREDITRFKCYTSEINSNKSQKTSQRTAVNPGGANEAVLRTYRLALTCTGEYAQAFLSPALTTYQDSILAVSAGMQVLVCRVNMIFEREVSVHLELIPHNDSLIKLYPNPANWDLSWPYNDFRYRSQTQLIINTITAVTGDQYDIGHMVTTGDGAGFTSVNTSGVVGKLGIVCTNQKGESYSSGPSPNVNPFIVMVVAHEMGHQFGAGHTFTYMDEAANLMESHMEPGSGSTIMSYAGTAPFASQNVQPLRDDYFHAKSIEQITAYVRTLTCVVPTPTSNFIAQANAGIDYAIPKSTPFVLKGTSTGASSTDLVTYCWEQYDPGDENNTYPSDADVTGPVFRSRTYSASPSRTLPVLNSILNNNNQNSWEVLPAIQRDLNFRLTVRTQPVNARIGNNTSDDMVVSIAGNTIAFKVDQPNGSESWRGDGIHTIVWDNGNTTASPVSCSTVKISLSTDGGQTFPTVLAASTPNDGTEDLTIPDLPTTVARIKIEAVGNIFFDISNANFTIRKSKDSLVKTDSTWKGSNGFDYSYTLRSFDDRGWGNASNISVGDFDGNGGAQFIWGDNRTGQPNTVTLRKKFKVNDLRAWYLLGHVEDDDAVVYINGTPVSTEWDFLAGPTVTNIDIRPYLIANDTNVVCIQARNAQCCSYGVYLQILGGPHIFYRDADGDGYGNPSLSQSTPAPPKSATVLMMIATGKLTRALALFITGIWTATDTVLSRLKVPAQNRRDV